MIVVAGEALIDLVPLTQDGRFSALPGGSPCNTAVSLSRLGHETRFFGRLSRDAFGQDIRNRLTAAGVDVADVVLADDPSTLAVLTMADDGSASYGFYVGGTSDFGWAQADRPQLPASCDAVHVGSLAAALEPAASVLHRLVESADAATVRSFDPNVRPALGLTADSYRARMERWVAVSDLVRTSDEDLAWLYPGQSPSAAARRWRGDGPSVVVVSRGAAGVTAFVRDDEVEVQAGDVTVVDTVGAGDSLTAGLLVALAERGLLRRDALAEIGTDELAGALRFAADVAAVTCSRAGADPPWRDELLG